MNISELGKPLNFKSYNASQGTCSLFLKEFRNKEQNSTCLNINSKCNFQAFEKGVLLFSNINNKVQQIPLPSHSIEQITLIKGQEHIKPYPFSPFWILLKIGLPIRYARYFTNFRLNEYRTNETKLIIVTNSLYFKFITNGYNFENLEAFFLNSKLSEIITIQK